MTNLNISVGQNNLNISSSTNTLAISQSTNTLAITPSSNTLAVSPGETNVNISQGVVQTIRTTFVNEDEKLRFDGSTGDSYLVYNSANNKVEMWVDGVKQADWGSTGGNPFS